MRRNSDQTSDIGSDLLQCVRSNGEISRVNLSRKLGLAPSTVGLYVERLIADRYLMESEKVSSASGRPPILLRTNPDGGQFIGVDFEARNIMSVAVDFSDQPLRHSHEYIEKEDSFEMVIGRIEQAISKVMPTDSCQPLAIGVGVPGIVNSATGIASHYKYIKDWRNVPLAERLSERFGIPVFLENNARSMALAELWFGQGKGLRDFLCVGVRSGIGTGIIINGQLYCGAHHGAGELGRLRISLQDEFVEDQLHIASEGPQRYRELQDLASVRAIRFRLEKAIAAGRESVLSESPSVTVAAITQAVRQRDPLAREIVFNSAILLGRCVGQLVLVIDPAKVVLGGPVALWGDAFLEPFRNTVEKTVVDADLTVPEIVNSTMGEYGGALGAAALALHKWKPSVEPTPSEGAGKVADSGGSDS